MYSEAKKKSEDKRTEGVFSKKKERERDKERKKKRVKEKKFP